jgi:FKBP-type peptidyl-prolyl cis-trans isomerase
MKYSAFYGGATLLVLLASGCASTNKSSAASTGMSSSASVTTPPAAEKSGLAAAPAAGKEVELAGGLKYVDLKVGDGEIAESGLMATVHYTGWLTDGTKFDSSLDSGKPFPFRIDVDSVIQGWHEGVKGMRVGGKRHLTIPPDLAYKANGYPPVIPPNATLIFDIELLSLSR